MARLTAPIWDLPTRLFHWSLPLLLCASWVSAEWSFMQVHEWCGYAVLVLLGFRIAWGFVGSTHSRFAGFLRGPVTVWRHFRGRLAHAEGHNPAGGWSVVLMLLLLLTQALTGLFNADDIAFSGPLAHLVDEDIAGRIASWHELNFNVLLAFIGLHVITVLLYLRRGTNLVRPMLGGGTSALPARTTPAWIALLLLAGSALLLWWLMGLAPAPQVFL